MVNVTTKKTSDYVIGTGQMHSVKEFLDLAFSIAGLNYKKFVKIDKKFYIATVETKSKLY